MIAMDLAKNNEAPKEFSPHARHLIYLRTKGFCEKCGGYMSEEEMCAHHRLMKSHYGRGNVANGLGCHHKCHNGETDSIHFNPERAYLKGWIIPSWGDPLTYPLHLPDGSIVTLDNAGNYINLEA